jgi:class 3 adenylate cyclase
MEESTKDGGWGFPYEAVRRYLLQADERQIFRVLPRHIAAATNTELHPTLQGLVETMFRGETILHWEVHCPVCGQWGETPDWLQHAHHQQVCRACQSTFTVHLDGEAQVTFSPHPSFRTLSLEADQPEYRRELRARFPPTTVHELMIVQAFRDWAREQPLPEGEYLELRRVVIWFSDLTGSTALYARSGDPLAYSLVRDHFDLVFDAINQTEGAIVKTMGDGVMAVFSRGIDAVKAAHKAHQALFAFNRQQVLQDDRYLTLKVGIHIGPAIMVVLNERLDYFGTTVNVAARVSDLAQRAETVLTDAVCQEDAVREFVSPYNPRILEAQVRGLTAPLLGYRIDFADELLSRHSKED